MIRRATLIALAFGALVPAAAHADEFVGDAGVILGLDSPDARVVAQARSTVTVSGEMVIAFEGDPATCAAAGRCDTRGTLTWRPPREHDLHLSDIDDRGRRSVIASLFADDSATNEMVSQVRRARTGGGTAVCSDARGVMSGLEAVIAGGQLVLGVDPRSSGPLGSRCGGPVWADVRYILPRPRFDLAGLRKRGGAADLRAEQTFVAGGLRGTVRSTLVAQISRPRKVRPDQDAGDQAGRAPRLRQQRWRVAALSGSVRVDVRGASAPARCEPLDACGLSGSVTLTPKLVPKGAEVFGFSALPAIDGLRFGGAGGWNDAGRADATFTRPDAPAPCSDTVGLQAGALMLFEEGGRVTVAYVPAPGMRSRCAGPVLGSPFEAPLASGTVSLRRFLRPRRVTLRLTKGVARTVEGYRTASHPDLTIELVRRR